jgi:hypothetical protein
LHRLTRRRDLVVWVEENDLCVWISGQDIKTSQMRDSLWDKLWFKFWYWFFEVHNHNQLYQKIQNIIFALESTEVHWIRREKKSTGEISDHLALSPEGEEVYEVTSLIFSTDFMKKIWTGIIVAVVGAVLIGIFNVR